MQMASDDGLRVLHRLHCARCGSVTPLVAGDRDCYIETMAKHTKYGWDLNLFTRETRTTRPSPAPRTNGVTAADEAWVDEEVAKLAGSGVIEKAPLPATSDGENEESWISPIFVVRKTVIRRPGEAIPEDDVVPQSWPEPERLLSSACDIVGFTLACTGKRRLVMDLREVNELFDAPRFLFPGIGPALREAGPGAFIASGDYSSFFHAVPLHPAGRKFVRFQWKGATWQFRRLCFGLNLAPFVACLYSGEVVRAVEAEAKRRQIELSISAHIDDVVMVTQRKEAACHEEVRGIYETLSSSAGLTVNREKWQPFSRRATVLGIDVDMRGEVATAQPGPGKWDKLAREMELLWALLGADGAIKSWKAPIPFRLFEKICGRVGYFSDVVRGGNARRRGVMNILANPRLAVDPRKDSLTRRHLEWWRARALAYAETRGPPPTPFPGSPIQLMSLETILAAGDASERTVTGALEGPQGTLDAHWSVQLSGMTKELPRAARSSTAREFVGLLAAAKAVLAKAAKVDDGPRILVYFTDNAATAVWSIKGPRHDSLARTWEEVSDQLGMRSVMGVACWTERSTLATFDQAGKTEGVPGPGQWVLDRHTTEKTCQFEWRFDLTVGEWCE
jgi:hypothetical protein